MQSDMLNTMERLEKLKEKEEMNKYFDQKFEIDEEIVDMVSRLGYSKSYVISCLEDNEANHCTTTYYLLANEGPMID